ncbi:toll-like receptor 4 [Aplysia californica]|uniref:Toll-like receptor 4 n=1 Tax=Aplysia californica TaxID=6500 RepID=A0ABM0JZ46_APLCA|nr:toll-like receptor 4 [Aplysia californica]
MKLRSSFLNTVLLFQAVLLSCTRAKSIHTSGEDDHTPGENEATLANASLIDASRTHLNGNADVQNFRPLEKTPPSAWTPPPGCVKDASSTTRSEPSGVRDRDQSRARDSADTLLRHGAAKSEEPSWKDEHDNQAFTSLFGTDYLDAEDIRSYLHLHHPCETTFLQSLRANSQSLPTSEEYVGLSDEAKVSPGLYHGNCTLSANNLANCTGLQYQSVPKDLPPSIKKLVLRQNVIRDLGNGSFLPYPNLECLDISSNRLKLLENGAFVGLSRLILLKLWNNTLRLHNDTYPDDVFRPLESLKSLYLNKNNPNLKHPERQLMYPGKALSVLQNLTELFIDGIPHPRLDSNFRNMTSLKHLLMAGYLTGDCMMHALFNDSFINVPYLESLNLADCNILGTHIEAGVLEPLEKLTWLSISHNEDIYLINLWKVFYGLRNSQIKKLYMQTLSNRHTLGICMFHEMLAYLPRSLVHISADENNIEAVDRHLIRNLPPGLKTLSLSGNRFVFGTYLLDLHRLTSLTSLMLNGGRYMYHLPTVYPYRYKPNIQPIFKDMTCDLYERLPDDPIIAPEDDLNFNREADDPNFSRADVIVNIKPKPFVLNLPPKLTRIHMNMAGLNYVISRLYVNPNNTVESIKLQNNRVKLLEGPVYGLHSLGWFDASASFIEYISDYFFDEMPALKYLNLNSNLLGNLFSSQNRTKILKKNKKLKELNLSYNLIRIFPSDFLLGLTEIEVLLFQGNPLSFFQIDISGMKNLQVLDLSGTRVKFLSPGTRQTLDSLGTSVSVDMTACPIFCDCKNLNFLRWMTTSPAFNKAFKNYMCLYPDSSMKKITDGYNSTLEILNRECANNMFQFIIILSLSVAFLAVIMGGVVYRFRWKLRYLYYAAKIQVGKKSEESGAQKTFDYDAFICYAAEDQSFVADTLLPEMSKRGLRLFIHGRDFVAGEYITANIVKAVSQCRRTVVLLTKNMVDSYWCGYELQMATMEALHTDRKVLIFLLMGQLRCSELGTELLFNIKSNTYMVYPRPRTSCTDMARMWDKLAADIRD